MSVTMDAEEDADADGMFYARLAAFCSPDGAEVFQSIVHQPQIWSADPFDVETIHSEARDTFSRLLRRAGATPMPTSGRVLLLHGEAGSGKTHLLRACRYMAHANGAGYFGYLQMTTEAGSYGRYLLSNLISSLDQPYFPPKIQTSGLTRLSTGLFDAIPGMSVKERDAFRDASGKELSAKVYHYADRIVGEPRFAGCDVDLIRALIYLQREEPQLKSKVLKWLRCEDLATFDRLALGELVPRTQDEHPLEMVSQLGRLMYAVQNAALVISVDQLEDVSHHEMAQQRFVKIIDALVALVDAVPTAVVLIACLEDYYKVNRQSLTRSKLDRLEYEPVPVRLTSQRTGSEIEALVARRLEYLYEDAGLIGQADSPIYPFQSRHLQPLANLSARKVLDHCRHHHQKCILAGKWVEPDYDSVSGYDPSPDEKRASPLMEQAWNDTRSKSNAAVPDSEAALAELLAWGIERCNAELPDIYRFNPAPKNSTVAVEAQGVLPGERSFLVAVCNKDTRGSGLLHQVKEVEKIINGRPAVLVRSSAFPQDPKSVTSRQIGRLIGTTGRRVEVEDSDWRTLTAFRAFHAERGATPEFSLWQRESRPLSQLPALRKILVLDKLPPAQLVKTKGPIVAAPIEEIKIPVAPIESPKPVSQAIPTKPSVAPPAPLVLGMSKGVVPARVQMDVSLLKQHMAFLGGSGSGKTTAALTLIEQLLVRGIPAILLDRKGDLCRYADPDAWNPPPDPHIAARLRQLRERIEIVLFTPGSSAGRQLAIGVVPAGIQQLSTAEREEMAGTCAASLGIMMGYKPGRASQVPQLIVAKAIEVLAGISDGPVTLDALRQLIQDQDDALLNALGGGYEAKDYKKLGQDLLTLKLSQNRLLDNTGDPLEIDALLGRGVSSIPGKTRLTIINTQFIGSAGAVDFWVAQFFLALDRWRGKSPSEMLQAVVLLDEADQYLPATRQPAAKAPLESLLPRKVGGSGPDARNPKSRRL